MLNKRQALIGYLVYRGGKPFAKRAVKSKIRAVRPGASSGSRIPKRGGLLAGVGLLGALFAWRKRRSAGAEALPD